MGWAIALPGALFSLLLGALTLSLRIRLRPSAVYVTSLIGMAQIGLLQYLSGSGHAPFIQLLLLPALGAPASQSPRRCTQVLLTIGAVGASPLLYSTINAPSLVTEYLLVSVMTLMMATLVASTRTHRAQLKDASDYAKQLARTDPLTGLHNRRAFDETLTQQIQKAKIEGTPMSLILCDVDCFKQINDTLGHKIGDEVLKSIAKALSEGVRGPDAIFRWAGDEFVAILGNADRTAATAMAARLCDAVRRKCPETDYPAITICTGSAELLPGMSAEELLIAADHALLDQKATAPTR